MIGQEASDTWMEAVTIYSSLCKEGRVQEGRLGGGWLLAQEIILLFLQLGLDLFFHKIKILGLEFVLKCCLRIYLQGG